ncbi:FHA domain-containing protein [Stratiformator vulcanicus]|nr:FHA domain-containing protein [Stratiformator vulcanicus]
MVTLQILEGLERGRVYRDQALPLTMGREEENSIRLNDERVSRFHAKLQEESGQIILTDLDSTNGTRVNGRPVQIRVLRPGDHVTIGRCVLLYGGVDEIEARKSLAGQQELGEDELPREETVTIKPEQAEQLAGSDEWHNVTGGVTGQAGGGYEPEWAKFPQGLTALQRAQLSDLLDHVHEELKGLVLSAEETASIPEHPEMLVGWEEWQRLLKLEMELAVALRRITDPER